MTGPAGGMDSGAGGGVKGGPQPGAIRHQSAAAVRASARALIAAGNTLESVADVFQLPVDTLRALIIQPEPVHAADATLPVPPPPWHHFPGTITYRTGAVGSLTFALVTLLLMILLLWIAISQINMGAFKWILDVFLMAAIGMAIWAVQQIRAARVDRFDMRVDAIAGYTLAGVTVLPYADITGYMALMGKGAYLIKLLTRRGTGLTIRPTFAQMDDSDFGAWLRTIPERDFV